MSMGMDKLTRVKLGWKLLELFIGDVASISKLAKEYGLSPGTALRYMTEALEETDKQRLRLEVKASKKYL